MADEEDLEHQQHSGGNHAAASERPERCITVKEHDTTNTRTEEVIELAQVVLDSLAAESKAGGKNNANANANNINDDASGDLNINPAAAGGASSGFGSLCGGPSHKTFATRLKKKLDETYGGIWHAVVGTSFGGNVTNDEGTMVNFTIDGIYFLVLRSGPPDRPVEGEDAWGCDEVS